MATELTARYPVPDATLPFWRSELHELDSHRSTADLPEKQDIAVIGSGFAGAACAYYLTKDKAAPPSVTILEAREACSGATARNGGHLRPDLHVALASGLRTKGLHAANEIALFEVANAEAVKQLIKEEGISCDLTEVTSANVYLGGEQARAVKQQLDELTRLGCPTVDFIKYYGPDEAEKISAVKGAKAVTTFPAASLWPYKMVMHLLSVAVRKGANLQTKTPVLKLSATTDGNGYWTLSTHRGDTKAKKVIFATNGYTSALLPEYKESIHPVRGICSHITVARRPSSGTGELQTMALRYGPGLFNYQITRPDGSLIVGGAWPVIRPGEKDQWWNVVDDSKLIEPAAGYFDGLMERTFKGWEDSRSRVDQLWTGIMGYATDGMPHVGRVPFKPGLFVCAGFNGHGMPNVLLCAKGVVKMLSDGCDFADNGVPAGFETCPQRL